MIYFHYTVGAKIKFMFRSIQMKLCTFYYITILFSFRLPVCNACPIDIDIYIYIICVPTRNRNNEFILEFILREIKMADFER